MNRKIILIVLSVICSCFLLTSCYPELSVQQYDKLKEDLDVLNHQSAALEEELNHVNSENEALQTNNAQMIANNAEIKSYVDFITKLLATQNSEGQLNGKFDVQSLVEAKDSLLVAADNLTDGNIYRYISIIGPDNEVETMGAYYQALSTCIRNIKQKLGTIPSSVATDSSETN